VVKDSPIKGDEEVVDSSFDEENLSGEVEKASKDLEKHLARIGGVAGTAAMEMDVENAEQLDSVQKLEVEEGMGTAPSVAWP
jgi:hypothetical protein